MISAAFLTLAVYLIVSPKPTGGSQTSEEPETFQGSKSHRFPSAAMHRGPSGNSIRDKNTWRPPDRPSEKRIAELLGLDPSHEVKAAESVRPLDLETDPDPFAYNYEVPAIRKPDSGLPFGKAGSFQLQFGPLTQQQLGAWQARALAAFPNTDPLPENGTEVWNDLPDGRPVVSVHWPLASTPGADGFLIVMWYSRDLEWSVSLSFSTRAAFYGDSDEPTIHAILYRHAEALDRYFSSAIDFGTTDAEQDAEVKRGQRP